MNNDREPMSEALLAEIRERSRNRVVGLDIHVLIAEVERLQEELRYKEEYIAWANGSQMATGPVAEADKLHALDENE